MSYFIYLFIFYTKVISHTIRIKLSVSHMHYLRKLKKNLKKKCTYCLLKKIKSSNEKLQHSMRTKIVSTLCAVFLQQKIVKVYNMEQALFLSAHCAVVLHRNFCQHFLFIFIIFNIGS